MITKHHNYNYAGGSPNIPDAVGDRYYAQDLGRDFDFLRDTAGNILRDLTGAIPCILQGGQVSQGTGDTLNIAAGIGYAQHQVDIADNAAGTPPNVTQENIEAIRIEWTGQASLAIPSATLDGSTVNYVKVEYTEINSDTRTRARSGGTYASKLVPSFTITVDSTAPTNQQIQLATFTGSAGGSFVFNKSAKSAFINSVGPLSSVQTGSFTITSSDRIAHVEFTGLLADATCTLPLAEDNLGREIYLINNSLAWSLFVTASGSDTINEMASIELPRRFNFLKIRATSTGWFIVQEKITCRLYLGGSPGYGSVDTRIPRFSTLFTSEGNLFSENHSSGYNSDTEGLKITINKSGPYGGSFLCNNSASQFAGISLNASSTTLQLASLPNFDEIYTGSDIPGGTSQPSGFSIYLEQGDIIRPHSNGIPMSFAQTFNFYITYLG